MIEALLALALTFPGMALVDGFARPRSVRLLRRPSGLWLLFCITVIAFGVVLGLSGNPALAAALTLAVHLLFVFASNAKNRMLGEPLVFTDVALIGSTFRHPQFYFSVLAAWQKVAGVGAVIVLLAALSWLARPTLTLAITGAMVAAIGLVASYLSLHLGLFNKLARKPDVVADTAALGLLPSLTLYWLRWRESGTRAKLVEHAPRKPTNTEGAANLIVVVQCESFADPVELFGRPDDALPSLEAARADALQWGSLLVSGFGAYTMRTEYGVLFGRDEAALGFRLYDPYLTAIEDAHYALPHRLGVDRWQSLFVHPHDMRFYNRNRILPSAGFAEMIGEAHFATESRGGGRYVTDEAVAGRILAIAGATNDPTFVYAVTIENHGPWAPRGDAKAEVTIANYNRLVCAGDRMLGQLREGIAQLARPAILVFFGDHRPSIPGVSIPGGERHTPYVIVKFDAEGRIVTGSNRRIDVTPAQLHHAILDLEGGHADR